MSLPDGAEYWESVSGHNRPVKYEPTHAKGGNCHLRGHYYTNDIEQVTCHFCKRLLTPEILEAMAKAHANNLRNRAAAEKKKFNKLQAKLAAKHKMGICPCGHHRVKRVQRSTGKAFKGCSNYPKCTLTENIK